MWKSFISGGLSLLGDAIGMGIQSAENEKARQWAEKMRDYENAYSSPKQQIARLKEAGLNPALIYQNGAGSMTSASAPSPQNYGKSLGKIDFRQAMDAFLDAGIKDQQLKALQEDVENKSKQNELLDIEINSKNLDYKRKLYEYDNGGWAFDLGLKGQSLENLKTAKREMEARIDKMNADMDIAQQQLQLSKNADQRAQSELTIKQNIDERADIAHKYLQRIREESEINGTTFEATMNKLTAHLKNTDKSIKDWLFATGFDVNNPPTKYWQYQLWIDNMAKKAQHEALKASADKTNYENSSLGREKRALSNIPGGDFILAIYEGLFGWWME